jgi:hypothetical protein
MLGTRRSGVRLLSGLGATRIRDRDAHRRNCAAPTSWSIWAIKSRCLQTAARKRRPSLFRYPASHYGLAARRSIQLRRLPRCSNASRAAPTISTLFIAIWIHIPLFRWLGRPFVTTLHGRLDLPHMHSFVAGFADAPFENNQRGPLAELNFVETIYHGLPEQLLLPNL